MLDNLYYLDHAVLKLSYAEGSYLPDKGGKMSFTVDRTHDIGINENKDAADSLFIIDTISIKVQGENAAENSEDDIAFSLDADIEIMYDAPKSLQSELTKQFFEEEAWFFDNYAHMISHKVATAVMDETKFKSVVLQVPKSRFKKQENLNEEGA